MGRIKTRLVKAVTQQLLDAHRDSFNTDYEDNKKRVSELTEVYSKKLRNIVAGYVTRMMKSEAK